MRISGIITTTQKTAKKTTKNSKKTTNKSKKTTNKKKLIFLIL